MKPTAVLLAILLFVTGVMFIGCSFSTKEKTVTATHNDNDLMLTEPSGKKDTAPLSFPKHNHKQAASPIPARIELLKPLIDSISEGSGIACMPAIRKEENESDSVKEYDNVFGCVLGIEAEYPGGLAAWRHFLNRNLRFPEDPGVNGIQDTVVVKFIIDEEGNVTNVEAVRGSKVLIAEAMRVIKKSGKWTPGKRMDRAIKSYKTQPVIFRF